VRTAAVNHANAGVSQALRFPEESLERGARVRPSEAVEVEMSLNRKIAALEPCEVAAPLMARGALDAFAGREGIDLSTPGHEIGEKRESVRLLVVSLGKGYRSRKTQRLLAPPERPHALHLLPERFLVAQVGRKSGGRRRGLPTVQKLLQDLERSMARSRRLGHADILRQPHRGINARAI
jgi:hypothetical protein